MLEQVKDRQSEETKKYYYVVTDFIDTFGVYVIFYVMV